MARPPILTPLASCFTLDTGPVAPSAKGLKWGKARWIRNVKAVSASACAVFRWNQRLGTELSNIKSEVRLVLIIHRLPVSDRQRRIDLPVGMNDSAPPRNVIAVRGGAGTRPDVRGSAPKAYFTPQFALPPKSVEGGWNQP
jgi:hypothetical protein